MVGYENVMGHLYFQVIYCFDDLISTSNGYHQSFH